MLRRDWDQLLAQLPKRVAHQILLLRRLGRSVVDMCDRELAADKISKGQYAAAMELVQAAAWPLPKRGT